MSNKSQVVLDPDGKLRLFESGLWFGPFRKESVFLLEEHSKEKGLFARIISQKWPNLPGLIWPENGQRCGL